MLLALAYSHFLSSSILAAPGGPTSHTLFSFQSASSGKSLEAIRKQVNANLYGIFNFSKAVLNSMIQRKSGTIINISSLAGKNAFVGGTMYGATKHALMGFTKSLMLEVREYNIRVAAICPGSVDTNFNPNREVIPEKKNILLSEDVAETVMLVLKMPVRAMVSEIDIRPTNPK